MTNQNNAAQAEKQAYLAVKAVLELNGVYFGSTTIKAIVGAVLSKLRAPVADEPPGGTRWPVLRAMARNYTAGKHTWDALDAEACEQAAEEIRHLRAALASAPVADERAAFARSITGRDDLEPHQVQNVIDANGSRWATWRDRAALATVPLPHQPPIRLSAEVLEYLKEGIENATQCEEADIDHDFANELGRLMQGPLFGAPPASAPVDPEATEVDFLVRVFENLDTWRAEDWNELLERRPAILALLRPLVLASAHPAQVPAETMTYLRKVAASNEPGTACIISTNNLRTVLAALDQAEPPAPLASAPVADGYDPSKPPSVSNFPPQWAIGAPVAGEAVGVVEPLDGEGNTNGMMYRNLPVGTQLYAAPQASAEDVRNAALEEAAAALEDHRKAGREWVPGSLWDTLSREAAARIRALKQPQADKDGAVDKSRNLQGNPVDRSAYLQGDKDGGQQHAGDDFDVEAAAKTMAECMDYPWAHMPQKGREQMRLHAQSVIRAALSAPQAEQGERDE